MKTKYSHGIILTVILILVPQAFLGQDLPAKKTAGSIVELSLIVTNQNGKALDTIGKDEIHIIENKVEQTVLGVDRDERPITYGLVIDSSLSLKRLIASALEAAKMIIINRREADEIFIARFISTDKIEVLQDFTTDNTALLESLKSIDLQLGQSAVIDAVYVAAEHVAKRAGDVRRKAVVIITDGEDRQSYTSMDNLIKLLREKGVQVFILGMVIDLEHTGTFFDKSARQKAETLLNRIAKESGGLVFYPATGPQLIDATAEVITNLRAQFRVTYQSSKSGKRDFRKVDVKVIAPSGEERRVVIQQGQYLKDVQANQKEQKSP